MTKNRLEAFSDGVIAIIITIMVLELKVPHGSGWSELVPLISVFLSYILSFTFVGIYWNNHHHLIHAAKQVTAPMMWANLHLLFWLSIIPFVTGWLGHHSSAPGPTVAYGVIMVMCALAYTLLQRIVVAQHDRSSELARRFQSDLKGKISLGGYVIAVGVAFAWPWMADCIFVAIALLWLAPDRRAVIHAE